MRIAQALIFSQVRRKERVSNPLVELVVEELQQERHEIPTYAG